MATISEQPLDCHILCQDSKANALAIQSYLQPLGVSVTLHDKIEPFLQVPAYI